MPGSSTNRKIFKAFSHSKPLGRWSQRLKSSRPISSVLAGRIVKLIARDKKLLAAYTKLQSEWIKEMLDASFLRGQFESCNKAFDKLLESNFPLKRQLAISEWRAEDAEKAFDQLRVEAEKKEMPLYARGPLTGRKLWAAVQAQIHPDGMKWFNGAGEFRLARRAAMQAPAVLQDWESGAWGVEK